MYPIVHVIYGVPLTRELAGEIERMEADEGSEWFEDAETTCGFTVVYSGVAERLVGFCGVSLAEHPCVQEPLGESDLPTPSSEQIDRAKERLAALPASLRALCPSPGRWLVFGTS